MKQSILAIVMLCLALALPTAFAASVGQGVGIDIETEDFAPQAWLCDSRVVYDDATEPGRVSEDGTELVERINNYAFEGEQVSWSVLVMDKNGIEKVGDVFVSVGDHRTARELVTYYYNDTSCMNSCATAYSACSLGCSESNESCPSACTTNLASCQSTCARTGQRLESNAIEANCRVAAREFDMDSCNARILEEQIDDFDREIMALYDCTLTVETPDSMYGEYWVTIEAEDLDGVYTHVDEVEYWFFNPVIALSIDGALSFENVRPGTSSYSDTLLVENDADAGSGVMLDMFITGTDFYDSSSSGAKCPTSNQLTLDNFRYYVASGSYSTADDPRSDIEGYNPIRYGIGFNNPIAFYNYAEILQAQPVGPYYTANILAPGAEMAITFRLNLPEPCNGDFDSGSIYFWGEAI